MFLLLQRRNYRLVLAPFFHSDLPNLKRIIFGDHVFESEDTANISSFSSFHVSTVDLPKLEEIRLGWTSLSGKLHGSVFTLKGTRRFLGT